MYVVGDAMMWMLSLSLRRENISVVVSFVTSRKEKTLTWCLGLMPRCTKWRSEFIVIWYVCVYSCAVWHLAAVNVKFDENVISSYNVTSYTDASYIVASYIVSPYALWRVILWPRYTQCMIVFSPSELATDWNWGMKREKWIPPEAPAVPDTRWRRPSHWYVQVRTWKTRWCQGQGQVTPRSGDIKVFDVKVSWCQGQVVTRSSDAKVRWDQGYIKVRWCQGHVMSKSSNVEVRL